MSRWNAASDLDYREEMWGPSRVVRRTCWDCGTPVYVYKAEPYQIHEFCYQCIGKRVTREAKRGQA